MPDANEIQILTFVRDECGTWTWTAHTQDLLNAGSMEDNRSLADALETALAWIMLQEHDKHQHLLGVKKQQKRSKR